MAPAESHPLLARVVVIAAPVLIGIAVLTGCGGPGPVGAPSNVTTTVSASEVRCGTCSLDGRVAPPC